MDKVYPRCCGLDVHKKTVSACARVDGRETIETFGTSTRELLRLGDWLAGHGVAIVAMESTGVFWKPVWNLLEERFELMLVNAHHIKQVPGRKTDVKDCDWLSDLQRHGLIRPGFVPPRPIRELREPCRYRNRLVQLQAGDRNRLIKVLETAGIKLAGVASDVFGVSGWAMLRALIEGEASAAAMAGWRAACCAANAPNRSKSMAIAVTNEYLTAARAMGLAHEDFATVFKVLAKMASIDL